MIVNTNENAKRNEFSIQKGRFVNKNERINRQDYYSHHGGFLDKKNCDPSKEKQNRKSSRSGCNKAILTIKLKKFFEIFPKEWQVV